MGKLITVLAVLVVLMPGRSRAAICGGDCNLDGRVTAEEIVLAGRVAAGSSPLGECAAVDTDDNHVVSAEELIAATDSLLLGCPYAPHPRPVQVDGCENGYLVGEFFNLSNSNVTTSALELQRASGKQKPITLMNGEAGTEITGTFASCPNGQFSRIVTVGVRATRLLAGGEYFIDAGDVSFAYAEAQSGPGAYVRGWRARDGVVVIDEISASTFVFHVVGAYMSPDSASGPTGTFHLSSNGAVDELTP